MCVKPTRTWPLRYRSLPPPSGSSIGYLQISIHSSPFTASTGVNHSSQEVIFQIKYGLRSSPWNKTVVSPKHYPSSWLLYSSPPTTVHPLLLISLWLLTWYPHLTLPPLPCNPHFQISLPKALPHPLNSGCLFSWNYQCDAYFGVEELGFYVLMRL